MAKILTIVNGVSYYTTTTALKKQTSSCHTMQNSALFFALDCMGKDLGIARTVVLYDGKMKRHSFDIQLTVV
jgi:hypothetical protein